MAGRPPGDRFATGSGAPLSHRVPGSRPPIRRIPRWNILYAMLPLAATAPPSLLVTIDTEEEGLWGEGYRSHGNTVRNLRGLPRFQDLCDEFGVCPTYLVDTPVVEDDQGSELLATYQRTGRAEVGGHLHPWCTAPFTEELNRRNSYLCNLPEELQRAKLETLTAQIHSRFGRSPTSFRAGRYGIGLPALRILAELGYLVDSSVVPFTSFAADGGPDFRTAPWQPYRVDADNLLRPATTAGLAIPELPVGAGFTSRDFSRTWSRRQRLQQSPWRFFRLAGLLDRVGIGRRIKLSPEQATGPQMVHLLRNSLAQQATCLVMLFHSSSLIAGGSPYVPDRAALDEFFARLRHVFEFWCRASRPTPTLTGFVATLPETA